MNPVDKYGYSIFLDDIVIFNPPRYKGIYEGKVTKLYPKSVEVSYKLNDTCMTDCRINSKDCVVFVTNVNDNRSIKLESN